MLIPSDQTVVRYTNESLIVLCRSRKVESPLHWLSPHGEIIEDAKGRIHTESNSLQTSSILQKIKINNPTIISIKS